MNCIARSCKARFLAGLLLAISISGCSSLRSIDLGQGEYWIKSVRPLTRSESLLHYFDYARGLSAAELGRENESLRQAFATDKSDFTRLRYALLLSMPGTGARDLARAQQLLDPVRSEAEGRDPALRALAVLLVAEIAERRRLEDSLQSATQRQKDEQARAGDLEQKLEALKSIEKSIGQRDRKAPPAGAPAAPASGAPRK
jgi:hypothetical protein